MRFAVAAAFAILAGPAFAQQYLQELTPAAAQARSAQGWHTVRCQPQLQCDADQNTQYLWAVQPLTDGSAALVVMPNAGDPAATMTLAERALLVNDATMGVLLPWRFTLVQMRARFTTAEWSAAAADSSPAVRSEYQAMQTSPTTSVRDPAVISFVVQLVADGIVTQAEVPAILAEASTP